MGSVTDSISTELADWLQAQHLFFVATAPLSADGHVNLSPKGLDTFRMIDEHTVAWLDLTGSGAETIAHFGENGRATLMFCAFDGPPRIVRLYGRGEVLLPGTPGFAGLAERLPSFPATRSILRVLVHRVAKSCGFGVPFMDYVGERGEMRHYAIEYGEDGMAAFRRKHNRTSIDGLPALRIDD